MAHSLLQAFLHLILVATTLLTSSVEAMDHHQVLLAQVPASHPMVHLHLDILVVHQVKASNMARLASTLNRLSALQDSVPTCQHLLPHPSNPLIPTPLLLAHPLLPHKHPNYRSTIKLQVRPMHQVSARMRHCRMRPLH